MRFRSFGTIRALSTLAILGCSKAKPPEPPEPPRVLVFAAATPEPNATRDAIVALLDQFAKGGDFRLERGVDPTTLRDSALADVRAIVLPDDAIAKLDANGRVAFEHFVESGGGVVAIHRALVAPADAAEWPWYRRLVSGLEVEPSDAVPLAIDFRDGTVPSAPSAPLAPFTDAPIVVKDLPARAEVVLTAKSDVPDAPPRPLSWRREYDGGRVFATALCDAPATCDDPRFQSHLRAAIRWTLAGPPRRADRFLPSDDCFDVDVVVEGLSDPIEIAPAPNGDVFVLERKGALKRLRAREQRIETIHQFEVAGRTSSEDHALECGGLGLALDPNFSVNSWLYVYWSPLEPSVNRLSRFTLIGNELTDRHDLLDVATDREHKTCHEGGSVAFGPDGCLFVSCGDNTDPFESDGYAPIDGREGRKEFDARRSSGNSNDLRGSILRVRPQDDGTIAIPDGNLWPRGTAKTRPEIYAKGCRNPYRISVDPESGDVWYGDVGPDASDDKDENPRGYDLLVQVRHAACFGWPFFRGGRPYRAKDFEAGTFGASFADGIVNDSPNNTGLTALPLPEPPVLFFPYAKSDRFPELGDGGRNAMAGPVCRSSRLRGTWPPYFDGVMLFYDWMRTHVFVVVLDPERRFVTMHRFLKNLSVHHPIDMEMGKDGSLWVLDYGTNWWDNADGRLLRVRFGGFDRKPIVALTATPTDGAVPLTAKFTSGGSRDPEWDGDAPPDPTQALRFHWDFGDGLASDLPDATHVFRTPGVFDVQLTATDVAGKTARKSTRVIAGNTAPKARLVIDEKDVPDGRFTWDTPLAYTIEVDDAEDGAGAEHRVPRAIVDERAVVTAEYFKDGKPDDDPPAEPDALLPGMNARLFGTAQLKSNGCAACHHPTLPSAGPSFEAIAKAFGALDGAARDAEHARLVAKVRSGGAGRYGTVVMTPHPQLSDATIENMLDAIVDFGAQKDTRSKGEHGVVRIQPRPEDDGDAHGVYAIHATYADKGATNLPSLTTTCATVWLEAPRIIVPLATGEEPQSISALKATVLGKGAKREGDHIGFWDDPATKLAWTVHVAAAGKYRATLNCAVPDDQAGSTFVLSAGDSKIRGTFTSTSGWEVYREVPAGEIEFAGPGDHEIELAPETKAHDSIANVRTLVLTALPER